MCRFQIIFSRLWKTMSLILSIFCSSIMADPNSGENYKGTRYELIDKVNKKAKIVYGEAFRAAISKSLEEVLDVTRANLSSDLVSAFDQEVTNFYQAIPPKLAKCHRDKRLLKKKYKLYFGEKIVLVPKLPKVCFSFI